MAKDANLDLSAVLSSDERVVFETRPHPFRQVLRTLVVSILWVIAIVGILAFVKLGRSYFSDAPIVSTALNAAYDFAFEDESAAFAALLFYLIFISWHIWGAYVDSRSRETYFVTNKRVIWWSKRIRNIMASIPLASVKMISLEPPSGRWRQRYGMIIFWSQVDKSSKPEQRAWLTIRDPESVLRKLQAMTPEPDPLLARRGYIRKSVTYALVGLFLISNGVYLWNSWIELPGEAGANLWVKMTCELLLYMGIVTVYEGIGDLREARKVVQRRKKGV